MAVTNKLNNFQNVLLARGLLTEDKLREDLAEAGKTPIEKFLAQNKLVDINALTLAIAAYFNLPPMAIPPSFLPPRSCSTSRRKPSGPASRPSRSRNSASG